MANISVPANLIVQLFELLDMKDCVFSDEWLLETAKVAHEDDASRDEATNREIEFLLSEANLPAE